jgi:hypothetical protein
VLVIERLVPTEPGPHPAKALDVNMLVLTGGKERTRVEFEELLATADLRLSDVIATEGGVSIVEASAV